MGEGNKTRSFLMTGAAAACLLGAPSAIRAIDRRREARQGVRDRPLITGSVEKTGICSLDGTSLYVDYLGENDPTVFLVHGYAVNNTEFRHHGPCLAGKYRVVSFDLRGHGRSEVPQSRDYATERLAEDLRAVVDAFNPGSFVVAGHSLGGLAAFKFHELFGGDYRGRLKGLAIIDSTGADMSGISLRWGSMIKSNARYLVDTGLTRALMKKMRDSSACYALLRWLAFGRKPPASEVEELQRMNFSTPIATLRGAARGGLAYKFEYYLPNVNIPVMLLVGSDDTLMASDRRNRLTYSVLPQARLRVFEGAGHMAPQEQPDEFNEALGEFLAQCFA